MIYAGILAGGKGTRMGRTDMPKQFLTIGNKPIIIHTIEKFILNDQIEQIIVAVPKAWITHMKNLCKKYITDERVVVVEGGNDRNDSIMALINHIEKNNGLTDEDILITHDAVRPFINSRIINDNIKGAMINDAVDTVIPAIDTIVESTNGDTITDIPIRDNMYQGQTPQTFKAKKLKDYYNSLTEEQKAILSDGCKIFLMKNDKVSLVQGEVYNIKVTTPTDLKIAEAFLGEDKND